MQSFIKRIFIISHYALYINKYLLAKIFLTFFPTVWNAEKYIECSRILGQEQVLKFV